MLMWHMQQCAGVVGTMEGVRCRANMAHIGQLMPDSDLGSYVKVRAYLSVEGRQDSLNPPMARGRSGPPDHHDREAGPPNHHDDNVNLDRCEAYLSVEGGLNSPGRVQHRPAVERIWRI